MTQRKVKISHYRKSGSTKKLKATTQEYCSENNKFVEQLHISIVPNYDRGLVYSSGVDLKIILDNLQQNLYMLGQELDVKEIVVVHGNIQEASKEEQYFDGLDEEIDKLSE